MDTRQKIISSEALNAVLAEGEWIAVVGLFDPLTAVQAKRLAQQKADNRKLLAIVLEGERTLLPAGARAILVAALRDVNAVCIAQDSHWREYVPQNGYVEMVEDDGEEARSAEFRQFVIERQSRP